MRPKADVNRLGRRADTLEDAATELQAVITVVEATSQPMSRRDPLRPLMDIIYKYAQDKSPFKPSMVPRVSAAASPMLIKSLDCQLNPAVTQQCPSIQLRKVHRHFPHPWCSTFQVTLTHQPCCRFERYALPAMQLQTWVLACAIHSVSRVSCWWQRVARGCALCTGIELMLTIEAYL